MKVLGTAGQSLLGIAFAIAAALGAVTGTASGAMAQSGNSPKGKLAPDRLPVFERGCNQARDGFACHILARHHTTLPGSPANNSIVRRTYKDACAIAPRTDREAEFYRKITAESCRDLGTDYLKGTFGAADADASTPVFARGCDLGDRASCAYLGENYKNGRGAPRDKGMAMGAYRKGCAPEMPVACFHAARLVFLDAPLVERGKSEGSEADIAFARKAARTACATKWQAQGLGCFYDASYLASGWGGPQNRAAALPSYQKACEMRGDRLDICFLFGDALIRFPEPMQDREKGLAIMEKGCAQEHSPSCDRLESEKRRASR